MLSTADRVAPPGVRDIDMLTACKKQPRQESFKPMIRVDSAASTPKTAKQMWRAKTRRNRASYGQAQRRSKSCRCAKSCEDVRLVCAPIESTCDIFNDLMRALNPTEYYSLANTPTVAGTTRHNENRPSIDATYAIPMIDS